MTTTAVHQCFRCELRFRSDAELEDHLVTDHEVDLRHPADPAPSPEPTSGSVTIAVSPVVPAERVTVVAAAIARQAGMGVELVEVDEPGLYEGVLERYLRTGTERARAQGATVTGTRRLARSEEGVAATLLDYLRGRKPTMAAMLTRRRHATGDVVLGSVSRPVVAGSPVPVLLTHPNQEVAPHYGRVVVGVDGSELAERAVGSAAHLAGRLGARLWIVGVADPSMLPNQEPEDDYVHRLADTVEAPGLEVGHEVVHGPVRRSLAHLGGAEPGTILVLGTHGRSGSRIGSLGSVSRDVVRRADCPVLVVGPRAEV
jgi:nucleotide-binding universal stress UspA family protein